MNRVAGGLLLLLIAVGVPICTAGAEGGYRLLVLDGHEVKWGAPDLGAGVTLRYAIAQTSPRRMGTRNCTNVSGIRPLLRHAALSQQRFAKALTEAFDMWEQVADVRFTPAKNQADADFLITAQVSPDGIAYTDLTTKASGEKAIETITHGIVCLNPQLLWSNDSRGTAGSYNLTAVLAHEIGHILGLDHPGPHGEMMSFEYDPQMTHLQAGDIAGIEQLYGRKKPLMSAAIGPHIAAP